MICGAILAFCLVPPEKIVRKDGTRVQRIRHPSALSVPYYPSLFKGKREELIDDWAGLDPKY